MLALPSAPRVMGFRGDEVRNAGEIGGRPANPTATVSPKEKTGDPSILRAVMGLCRQDFGGETPGGEEEAPRRSHRRHLLPGKAFEYGRRKHPIRVYGARMS